MVTVLQNTADFLKLIYLYNTKQMHGHSEKSTITFQLDNNSL